MRRISLNALCALWLAACNNPAASSDDGATSQDGSVGLDGSVAHDFAGDTNAAADLASMAALFPLVVGHQWTYSSKILGSGAACGTTMTQTVSSANPADGRAAFQITTLCPPPTQLSIASFSVTGGDGLDYDDNGTWVDDLDPMVVDGHSWPSFPGYTSTWQRVSGPVTVTAGTFSDCWNLHTSQQSNAYTTYCRGVGEVFTHFDLNGSGAEWQLTSKNF